MIKTKKATQLRAAFKESNKNELYDANIRLIFKKSSYLTIFYFPADISECFDPVAIAVNR